MSNDTKPPESPKKDDAKEPSPAELLAAKKKELADLEAKKELDLVLKRIDALKNDPKAKRLEVAKAKQEKTVKETIEIVDGSRTEKVKVAVYRLNQPAYKPLQPNDVIRYLAPETIVRILADKLPGESMDAVTKAPSSQKAEYV